MQEAQRAQQEEWERRRLARAGRRTTAPDQERADTQYEPARLRPLCGPAVIRAGWVLTRVVSQIPKCRTGRKKHDTGDAECQQIMRAAGSIFVSWAAGRRSLVAASHAGEIAFTGALHAYVSDACVISHFETARLHSAKRPHAAPPRSRRPTLRSLRRRLPRSPGTRSSSTAPAHLIGAHFASGAAVIRNDEALHDLLFTQPGARDDEVFALMLIAHNHPSGRPRAVAGRPRGYSAPATGARAH